jgi:asparagine synthase (glutamine-hydrolysing)
MCGIAGIVSRNTGLVTMQRMASATRCLQHRGPEQEGIYTDADGGAALGHRRLSIIDLTEAAAQPLRYLDRYIIIHNGEIYNYLELRQELKELGYAFVSRSDTEVIAAAYAAWGDACPQRFDGMFSFALWDEQEKKLFAARDRFGEKPFFFFSDEEQFVFASELRALWTLGVPKEVSRPMIYNFLSISYTTNPADPKETFYKNVYKLPAASFLTCSLHDLQVKIQTYWQLDPANRLDISEEDAVAMFRERFDRSIGQRLRSDVPIGTSLSGGLDSSAVVAFCHRLRAENYTHRCFTASFKNSPTDERSWAEKVARQYGLEHHVVEMDGSDLVALMTEVMGWQEEPFSTASVLAQYKVYELAKQCGVTVLLDGQGADEVLAGYHKYYRWYWQELYRTRELGKSGELHAARALGVQETFGWKEKAAAMLPEFTASLLQSRKSKQAYLHPDLDRDFAFTHKRQLYYTTPTSPDLNGVLYFNSFVQGLEELLRMADRNSMAHATEVRLPFLQHELVEFLFSLPPSLKIHNGWTKWLLRRSIENELPNEIAWRRDKKGFEPPQKQWMQNPGVQQAITEGKKKLVDAGILNSSVLKKNHPHDAYTATGRDWKYWSASFLF